MCYSAPMVIAIGLVLAGIVIALIRHDGLDEPIPHDDTDVSGWGI